MNITKITNYFLIFLLIAFSGIPFFYRADILMLIAAFIFPLTTFIVRKRRVDKFIVIYIIIALCIQMLQMLKFNFLPTSTFMGLHLRLLFAYLILRSVGIRSIDVYVNVIVFFTLVSFFFYFACYSPFVESLLVNKIAPAFENPLIKPGGYRVWPNVILYTFNFKGEGLSLLKRNSGPFWEPGAYAGFLSIAILFQIIRTGSLSDKKNKILMLGLLSTFSTTGLVALLFIIFNYLYVKMKTAERLIIVPILILGFIVAIQSVDFLGQKIMAKMSYDAYTYNTRFKSAAIDLKDFAENPFVGVGRSSEIRFKGQHDTRANHRNNGVTNHLAMYGIIYFIAYFYLIYLGFKRYCQLNNMNLSFAIFCILTIFLIGFSEIYFNKVFFYGLTMLYFIYGNEKDEYLLLIKEKELT